MLRLQSSSYICLTCLVTFFGCNGSRESNSSSELTSTRESSAATAPALPEVIPPSGAEPVDLSIPKIDPKPVIWYEDWTGPEEPDEVREKAYDLAAFADRFKSLEQFERAEDFYRQAIEADPAWGYPRYQLACNYLLWSKPDLAEQQFDLAMELGFDDFPMALTDDELGHIRDRPDFEKTLQEIRQRYIESSQAQIGQPIALKPDGDPPAEGWPVMMFLHGYGDNNIAYLDQAEWWAEQGFLSVTVPGSVPAGGGRYIWDLESTSPTHADLQTIVASPLLEGVADRQRIFLLGFSQGALHAMLLTAEHPELYMGVVGLSPGGSLANRLATPNIKSARPARCVFIHGTQERHAPLVRIWDKACTASGWKFLSKTHPGAHHFPRDWEEMRPEIAAFLLK